LQFDPHSDKQSLKAKIKTMKTITLAATFILGVGLLAGCASNSKPVEKTDGTSIQSSAGQTPAGTNVLSDEKARVSYAIGMMMGHNLKAQEVEVNPSLLVRGLQDVQSGGATLLTPQEMHETLAEFQKTVSARMRQKRDELAMKGKAEGEAFLARNKTQPGVVTMPDGLQYKIIKEGNGPIPTLDDAVTVNYRGTLIDGTEFDSSAKTGHPAKFDVNSVVPGWIEALTHMKVGSKWEIYVPSALAYGERGRPGIPPNAVLIFEVELLSAERSRPAEPLTSDIIKVPSLDEMKKGAKIEVIKPEDVEKSQSSQTNPPAK
jgi:FKBP-type peptidyl-prolyl cis-trans isomerase FklB